MADESNKNEQLGNLTGVAVALDGLDRCLDKMDIIIELLEKGAFRTPRKSSAEINFYERLDAMTKKARRDNIFGLEPAGDVGHSYWLRSGDHNPDYV